MIRLRWRFANALPVTIRPPPEPRPKAAIARCLCVLEVDDQFVLGRCLYRQLARLLVLKDAIDVSCRAAVLVDEIRPIRDQATTSNENALPVHRGQFMSRPARRSYRAARTPTSWPSQS